MDKLEWRCLPQPHYYLIICKTGVFELGETLDKQRYDHAIDRIWQLRRVIADLTRNMEAVVASQGRERPERGRLRMTAVLGGAL